MSYFSDLLNPLLARPAIEDSRRSERLEKLVAFLKGVPTERAELLAAFALLLGRVALADDVVSESERKRTAEIFVADLGLTEAQARSLAELALARDLCIDSDHHIVLRRVRELAPVEERLGFVRALFRLAAVDDISSEESDEISLIVNGIGLSHQDFIAIRSEFREHLSILKGLTS